MISNVAMMLRVVALRIDPRNPKRIPTFLYILTGVCAVCYIYNYQISMLWFVFRRCRETGDVVAAMMVLSTGTTSLIGITKLFCVYYYQDNVQSMVGRYIEYDTTTIPPAAASLMLATMRNVKKRALLFGVVMMGNGFAYNLQPLFKPGRHLMDDDQILYGLEPMLETPNYQIALVNIILSVNFICFIVSNITGLLIITTGYSESRLLALSLEIQDIWQDALQHYRDNFNANYIEDKYDETATTELNKYVKHRLFHIQKSHFTNINLVKSIEDIFRYAIVVEFFLLTLSLIADLLGGLEHTYIIMPFALMQVGMDCFTGQRLMDASFVFEAAVYDCKWENFDASNRKTVQLMLQISQKTLVLSAGGVTALSFGCLMSMIRSIYSAYTALRSAINY
uniref:Odorant receptor n=1 Tax=Ctenopseustis herana TaxID=65029 RepID=A0A097ITT9_9NEOP|nr:olfactory receptor 39 [Ctenopseustis herana]